MSEPETPEQLAERKERERQDLLAEGWRPEELNWHPPRPPEPVPTEVHHTRYDEDTKTFLDDGMHPRTPRQQARAERFEQERQRGMWTIKGDGVKRRLEESRAARVEGLAQLLVGVPHAARIVEAFSRYTERHDRDLPTFEVESLRAYLFQESESVEPLALTMRAYGMVEGVDHKPADAEFWRRVGRDKPW